MPADDTFSNLSDWNQYARLVVHELERLNDGQREIAEALNEVLRQQAVDKQAHSDFRTRVDHKHSEYDSILHAPDTGLVPRVGALEQRETIKNAVVLDRRWLIGGGVGIVTALVIPLVALVNSILNNS